MAATTRVRLVVGAAAVVVSAVGAVAWSRAISSDRNADVVLDEPGQYVLPGLITNPALVAEALPGIDLLDAVGNAVRLEPDGRPMVVNLWYSQCPPCARELADFAVVHDELGDAVRFVGVNPQDTAATMTSSRPTEASPTSCSATAGAGSGRHSTSCPIRRRCSSARMARSSTRRVPSTTTTCGPRIEELWP